MEIFARSSTTLFAKVNLNKPLSPSPLKPLPGRSEVFFSRCSSSNVHVHLTSLLRHKALHSVASSQTEVLTSSETAGIGFQAAESSEAVHVQFQLHKECKFGESFLLVGNEPLLGQWNPKSAIPLNWSDGHIWTVELDVPVGIAIQYKFILQKDTGDLLWQPGPDRILHTWETKNTIAIAEDWKDSELQKITELQDTNHQNEALLANPEIGPIVPGNVTHPGEAMMNVNVVAKFSEDKPAFYGSNEFIIEEKAIKSADGTLLGIKKEVRVADDGNGILTEESIRKTTLTSKMPVSVEAGDKDTLVTYEGGPVLGPGLTPIQGVVSEALPKEAEKSMPSGEALPYGNGKLMPSGEAIPKELGKSMSADSLEGELGKSTSAEEALPNDNGKLMPAEEVLPKELGKTVSAEAFPELGKSMSAEEALPKEVGKSMSADAFPKEVGTPMSAEVLPKELGKSMSSEAFPEEHGKSISAEEALPKELGNPTSKEAGSSTPSRAAISNKGGKSMSAEALPKEVGNLTPSEEALAKEVGKSINSC